MIVDPRPVRWRGALPWLGLALLAAVPRAGGALPLLDAELSLDRPRPVLLAAAKQPAKDPSLDFDLLGKPPPPQAKVDDEKMKRRRWMLDTHQAAGLGLVGLQLATTIVGQLNYSDKYGSNAPVTGRYELTHSVLAYTTLAVFAVDGALALFAPAAPKREGWDRVSIHKIGMAVATAGMVAQGVVGIYADQREGYQNQAQAARAHLVIGYVTLAAVGVAVGALVF